MQFQDLPDGALFRLTGSDQLYRKQQDEHWNARQIDGTVMRVMGHCETVIPYGEVSQGLMKEKSYNLFSQPKPQYTWGYVNKDKSQYMIFKDGKEYAEIELNATMPESVQLDCIGRFVNSMNQAGK